MKIGVWNYYESLNKENFILLNENSQIGDGLLKPFNLMYKTGLSQGVVFNTLDSCNISEQDAFLFFDYPDEMNKLVNQALGSNKPKYLVIFESEIIKPDNWDLQNHVKFEKIFTWNDKLVDGEKYIKINFSHDIPSRINKSFARKFCTMIAGNKQNKHKQELYSKRVEAIRWFEKNYPEDFDLYGLGWGDFSFTGPRLVRALNRIKPLVKLVTPYFPSWKGTVERKRTVLEQYKFSICYENARDIPGYITEKIFDCFFAGCIPVYLGADNIDKHIPKTCFIDMRDFDSYEDLYAYLNGISESDYNAYISSIFSFLRSQEASQFTCKYFAETIIENLLSFNKV